MNAKNPVLTFYFIAVSLIVFMGCSVSETDHAVVKNKNIILEFNSNMQGRLTADFSGDSKQICDYVISEQILISGKPLAGFSLDNIKKSGIMDEAGKGTQWVIVGLNDSVKMEITITVYDGFPTMLISQTAYTNMGQSPLIVTGWKSQAYTISADSSCGSAESFWSFHGSSHSDRRNWILPLVSGFYQENYMGMNASDYGGGTPVADIWRADAGIAVGHVEMVPRLVSIPVSMPAVDKAQLCILKKINQSLDPGKTLKTDRTFVAVHQGDCFASLKQYSLFMQKQGIHMPEYRDSQYEPIWCAWGFERDFKTEQIYAALPKAKQLGFEWAVLDDGYQLAEGDWRLIPSKFPEGDASMRAFVDEIHRQGMKAKLWWAPMAVDPGTPLFEEHPEYLLHNEDGSTRDIEWWDAKYLCPAVPEVQELTRQQVIHFMKDWGYDGLKIDGQHLNAAPPCYNPAHHHPSPEASVQAVAEFFKMIYETAKSINPDAVVEICPCGDMYAYHTLPYNNQPVASDPLSSFQIRMKGKVFKALMGPDVPYYGDHVEHTDTKTDFATTVGIGGVIGTKFTWPMGSKPGSRVDLTPDKEAYFKKWVRIYKEKMLPKGTYLGELYDIGFDHPETHAIQKGDTLFYAMYADPFEGTVPFRGLKSGSYDIYDYVNDQRLGRVQGPVGSLNVQFSGNLLIMAVPVP